MQCLITPETLAQRVCRALDISAKDSVQNLFVTHPGLSAVVIFFSQSS